MVFVHVNVVMHFEIQLHGLYGKGGYLYTANQSEPPVASSLLKKWINNLVSETTLRVLGCVSVAVADIRSIHFLQV
jgi:hypothetical protein